MKHKSLPIILASASPRRKRLLEQINVKFKTLSVDLDEKQLPNEKPFRMVKRLADEKLQLALQKIESGIIITADTIVVLDGKIIGKPKDEIDAVKILKRLSGRRHIVYTGFAVFNTSTNIKICSYEKTFVQFRKLTNEEISLYVDSGSPMDKAGAYGIQDDFGAVFIQAINGCYYNVVGLPLSRVYHALKEVVA
jgi:septum formation protein